MLGSCWLFPICPLCTIDSVLKCVKYHNKYTHTPDSSAFEELIRQDDEASIPLWWPQHVGSCSPGGHRIWSARARQGTDQKFRRSVTDPRLCDQSWKWSPVWWLFSIAMDDMVLDLSKLWSCLYINPRLMQRLPRLNRFDQCSPLHRLRWAQ